MLRRVDLALALVSCAVISASARADVLVVDVASGPYTQIQDAVNAAHDGDTILVKGGSYADVYVVDKALTIVAESGANVVVAGTIRIDDLAASKTFILAGLYAYGASSAYPTPALYLLDDLGDVRVENCAFAGGARDPGAPPNAAAAAYVLGNSRGAAFTHCAFVGGDAGSCSYCNGVTGGAAVFVGAGQTTVQSRVALYDCNLLGGQGSSGADYVGGNGGPAVILQSAAFLHASDSMLDGGGGGNGCDALPTTGGRGGDGIVSSGGSGAWTIGTTITPGPPGGPIDDGGGCQEGQGPPGRTLVGAGATFDFGLPALDLRIDPIVRERHDVLVTVRGEPGTIVDLVLADATTFAPIPSWHGVRLTRRLPGLHPSMFLGEIPASTVLVEGLRLGSLPAGVAASTVFLQARGRGPGGRVLGGFAALTVLDSAY